MGPDYEHFVHHQVKLVYDLQKCRHTRTALECSSMYSDRYGLNRGQKVTFSMVVQCHKSHLTEISPVLLQRFSHRLCKVPLQ